MSILSTIDLDDILLIMRENFIAEYTGIFDNLTIYMQPDIDKVLTLSVFSVNEINEQKDTMVLILDLDYRYKPPTDKKYAGAEKIISAFKEISNYKAVQLSSTVYNHILYIIQAKPLMPNMFGTDEKQYLHIYTRIGFDIDLTNTAVNI